MAALRAAVRHERETYSLPANLSITHRCQFCSNLLHNWRDSVTTIRYSVIGDATLLILTLLPQKIHLRSELRDHLLQIFHARKLFADRSG